jgi:cytochrome P450
MTTELSADTLPLRTSPLGIPLLTSIQKDPLGAVRRIHRQFGDVAQLSILFRRICYIFDPEAVRQILVDHQADFTREPRQLKIFQSFQGRNVLTTEGPDWERQRRILAPGFSPKRIAGYMGLMSAAAADSVSSELPVEPGRSATVDVGAFTTRITMDVILRTLFSHPTTREEAGGISTAIRAVTRQSMRELFWAVIPPRWMPYPGRTAKLKHLRTIDSMIAPHIRARTGGAGGSDNRQDVLRMMLEARDDEPGGAGAKLKSREIHDNCIVLFGAGFDTSSSALTWWIGLMATHPEAAARLRDELDLAYAATPAAQDIARLPYLNATIKEAMRLYPPSVFLFNRVALKDVTIAGAPVRKGTIVAIPIWHLHHDERSFPDPDAFRPERFLPGAPAIPRSAYLPFGAGPHFCLGQHFATVEMALVAAQLMRQFELSLEEGTALPEPFIDLALKPKTPLRVRFTRRQGVAACAAA